MHEKIRCLSIVTLLIAVTLSAVEFSYLLTKDGDVYGDCKIELSQRGGGYFIDVEAKATAGDAVRTVNERITVDSEWLPTDYALSISSPEGDNRIAAKFNESGVEFTGKLGMGEVQTSVESTSPLSVWSEDIGIISVIALLGRMDYSSAGKSVFDVVMPRSMGKTSVTLSVTGQEKTFQIVHGERDGGWVFDALYDPNKNILSKLTVKEGFEAAIVDVGKTESIETVLEGYHPLTTMMLSDSDFLKRIGNIVNLQCNLAFNIPESEFERLYLNHFSQEFAGEITLTKAIGSIEVKKMGHKVTNAPDWPLYYPLKGYDEKYTMPERGIDSDDPAIVERAAKIVKPTKTLWDAARAINMWVNRNIEYDAVSHKSKETFTGLKGDSRSKALLCAALCRATGIPARIVSGVLWADGATDHTWVEVYLGDNVGWGPIDPTLNQADKIDATHISLWLGSQLPPVLANDVVIENVVVEN